MNLTQEFYYRKYELAIENSDLLRSDKDFLTDLLKRLYTTKENLLDKPPVSLSFDLNIEQVFEITKLRNDARNSFVRELAEDMLRQIFFYENNNN